VHTPSLPSPRSPPPLSHPRSASSSSASTSLRSVLEELERKRGQAIPAQKKLTEEQKQVYRYSNASLPDMEKMWVVGRVIETDTERALVETGLPGSPHVFKKTELDARRVVQTRAALERRTKHDIREGDVFHLRLQRRATPFGEPWLTLEETSFDDRRQLVWQEIRDRFEKGQFVKGRVLNTSSNGQGFIVGVAGFLCYLPASRCTAKTTKNVGVLQEFMILTIDDTNAMVILCEPDYRDRSLKELLS
jgi:ribosomal protein S1